MTATKKKVYYHHDWRGRFAKPKFTMLRGRDFGNSVHVMAQQIRSAAKLHKRRVSIKVLSWDRIDVVVRRK